MGKQWSVVSCPIDKQINNEPEEAFIVILIVPPQVGKAARAEGKVPHEACKPGVLQHRFPMDKASLGRGEAPYLIGDSQGIETGVYVTVINRNNTGRRGDEGPAGSAVNRAVFAETEFFLRLDAGTAALIRVRGLQHP